LIDALAERGSGHTPDRDKPAYWNGGIKWVSLTDSDKLDRRFIMTTTSEISDLGIRHSSAVLHPAETVILSRDAGVGKSAVLAVPMAVSQHFITWRCGPKLTPLFLYYWLQYNKVFFEKMAVGSTIKTIGLGVFKKLAGSFPPLPEQRKIADILTTWDEALANLDALIAAKERRKNALMQQLLTGKKRVKGFVGKWNRSTFGNLLQESRIPGSHGGVARKLTVKLYGKGVIAKQERILGSASTKYFVRRAGQFIYSKLDFLNGAFGIVPPSLDGFESTLDLPTFDVTQNCDAHWLLAHVSRPEFYTRQVGAAAGGRKARRVNPSEFLALSACMPEKLEQTAIAAILNTCDEELRLLRAKRAALDQQKRGLMQRLLTGKVRVNL
jgi:type I restriction enzyme S subunit